MTDVIAARENAQRAAAAQSASEHALKKLEWEAREREETMARQIAKLTEEVGFLRAKQTATFEVPDCKEVNVLRSTLSALETRFREVKELYSHQKRELEEAEFECETLKTTVERLKNECQDSSDRETNERKQRHTIEMSLIDLKKKLSEMGIAQKETEEAFKQSLNEINILRNELSHQSDQLKLEKRKALSFERELEQSKFLAERKDKEHRDTIDILTMQSKNYKSENENLYQKIETLSKELQIKMTRESKDATNLTAKLREFETKESSMLACIEDLQKKVAFYKDKATKRDYNSVSKNSILDKLAIMAQNVISVKEAWETEKFIIRQEMSCMVSLMAQAADTYFQNMKPRQVRRMIEQNVSSKIFSKFVSNKDGNSLATCTFGSLTGAVIDMKDLQSDKGSGFKYLEEELHSLSSKITPRKPNASSVADFKRPTAQIGSNLTTRVFTDLSIPSSITTTKTSKSQATAGLTTERSAITDNRFGTKEELPSTRGQLKTNKLMESHDSASNFIARINAKVMEKAQQDHFVTSVKTPVKQTTSWRDDHENIHPNVDYIKEFKLEATKDPKSQSVRDDKFNYQKIEKESEEIARRIQALKLKDFSHFKQ